MDKQEAIRHIEALYPPDSEYPATAKTGREIMDRELVRYFSQDWRNLPEAVLINMASTMIIMES